MPKWTKEQEQAIEKEGTNMIVSAGAGSGKTAVLTARVLRKLKQGVEIDHLLILTFTKAAAKEMKDRIRSTLEKENMKDQLDKIDSAYITTFDSYAFSLVKKYNYLLGVSKSLTIGDETVLTMKKKELLDEVFDALYEKEDYYFLEMIGTFCTKDDQEIRDAILTMADKLDLKYDKKTYLENYIETYFSTTIIKTRRAEYTSYLRGIILEIKEELLHLKYLLEGDFYQEIEDVLSPLIESKTYQDILRNIDITLPRAKKGIEIEAKKRKDKISKLITRLKSECIYESEQEMESILQSTRKATEVLIQILQELDKKYTSYKKEHEIYDFIDMSKMAIEIVATSEEVRESLKDYFNEIMVDEYQDTNDLQEAFLRLIENNNIYMVGDIKQSIYRFRNANPSIFKEKYDLYAHHQGGEKIDLNKNFRSRKEVLSNINTIFDLVMDDELGGARYKESHRMIFGNQMYEEEKTNQDYNFEFLHYPNEKDSLYRKEEIEAFIIAKDIKKKVEEGYLVLDKEKKVLRPITYSDFVILMDRSTHFDLYKQIFTYLHIPLSILKDESITSDYDFSIISHLVRLIIKTKKGEYDTLFRYSFLSVFRSYLFQKTDDALFQVLKTKDYFSFPEMNIVLNLANEIDTLTASTLLKRILEEFPFYEKRITVGGVNDAMKRFEYLENVFSSLESLGYTVYEIEPYLNELIEQGLDLKYANHMENNNSVSIMTIHKSKGLEFPILYLPGLTAKFNESDLKARFLFDDTYGFIVPAWKEGIFSTITKTLKKERYRLDEVSERIRLFYVSLTRAKEKIIFVLPELEGLEKEEGIVDIRTRAKYTSFQDIIKSIEEELLPYKKMVALENINVTRDYQIMKVAKIENLFPKQESALTTKELKIEEEIETTRKLSKSIDHLLTKEENRNRELGILFHAYLEMIDLKNPNYDLIEEAYKEKIKQFCNLEMIKKKDYEYMQEYEFMDRDHENKIHGIIDLLLEYDDHYVIIDYKLSNTKEESYKRQLQGYQRYIENKTGKKTEIYLYSIIKGTLEKVS